MNWKQELRAVARAVLVTVVVVVLAGLVVEFVNHTGIVTGLGFSEQIARAIVDTGVFAVTATVLWASWPYRRR